MKEERVPPSFYMSKNTLYRIAFNKVFK